LRFHQASSWTNIKEKRHTEVIDGNVLSTRLLVVVVLVFADRPCANIIFYLIVKATSIYQAKITAKIRGEKAEQVSKEEQTDI